MSRVVGEDDKAIEERLLDTLVKYTEATAHLTAIVTNHDREYVEGRKAAREHANGISAKIENLDRSLGELRLATVNAEESRQAELKRIFDLLSEERRDRREAVTEGRDGEREVQKSERDMFREMIQEEMGERKETREDNRTVMKQVASEVWKAGGKYIVVAFVILILAGVMKITGLNLADLLGLAGK